MSTPVDRPTRGIAVALSVVWASAQLFGARLFGQAASLGVAVIVARQLGPEAFGHYSFMLIAATLLSEIPGAGLDLSAVRLSAREWTTNPAQARGVLVAAALAKLAWGTLSAGLIGLSAGPVALGLGRPDLASPLIGAAIAAAAMALTDSASAMLQARGRFGWLLIASLLVGGLRAVPIVGLLIWSALTLETATVAFAGAAVAGGVAAATLAWRVGGGPLAIGRARLRELVGFSGWFVPATLLGVAIGGLDVVTLTHLAGAEATGLYASARTLALPLGIAGGALAGVLLPRLSAMASQESVPPYVGQVERWLTAAVAVVAGLLLAAAPWLVPLIYGDHYAAAVPIFQVLILAYSAQILAWPALVVVLVAGRPDIVAGLSLVMLVAVGSGYLIVAPLAGALGTAWVYLIGCALILGPYRTIAARLLRASQTRSPHQPAWSRGR